MKSTMLGMALAMLLAAPAIAQTSQAGSQSGASATSASGSYAASGGSSASVTQVYNVADPSSSSSDPSDPSSSSGDPTVNDNVNYAGGYSVHNVPDVVAPSWGGQNVCAVGASGGVAVAGLGLTFGGMWSDSGCERRNSAVVLYQMGEHKAAVALMCQDRHVAQAMRAAGQPCPGAMPAVSMAAPVAPVRPVAAASPPAEAGPRLATEAGPEQPASQCRMVFHYPTLPDGRPNPNGAGWMQKQCS